MATNPQQGFTVDALIKKIDSPNSPQNWADIRKWIYEDHDDPTARQQKKHILCTQSTEKVHTSGGSTQATPFQWACIRGAPDDILQGMIKIGGQDMIQKKDTALESNGLQWALGNKIKEETIELLANQDTILDLNKDKDCALHTAARFGSGIDVIKMLIDRGGIELLEVENENDCLPIHHACQFSLDLKVVEYLLDEDHGYPEALRKSDKDGLCPLAYAFEAGASIDLITILVDQLIQQLGEKEALSYLLSRDKTKKCMLFWTNKQKRERKKELLKKEFVKKFLNASFISPNVLTVIILDLYAQLVFVVMFSIGIDRSVIEGNETMNRYMYGFILAALFWRFLREVLQIARQPLKIYIKDLWNYFDLATLILVAGSAIILYDEQIMTNANSKWYYQGCWVCITSGFVWTELIIVLSYFRYDLLVFVSAVGQIIVRLVPYYLLATMMILSYGNMFYVANLIERKEQDCIVEGKADEALCTRAESYYTALAMFFSQDWIYFDKAKEFPLITYLSMGIALLMGILLLTILIVDIQNIYTEVNEIGRFEFWRRRLALMIEIDQSLSLFMPTKARKWISIPARTLNCLHTERIELSIMSKKTDQELEEFCGNDTNAKKFFLWYRSLKHVGPTKTSKICFLNRWITFLLRASMKEILLPGESFEKIVFPELPELSRISIFCIYPVLLAFFAIISIPGILSGGLLSKSHAKAYFFHGPLKETPSNTENVKELLNNMVEIKKDIEGTQSEMEALQKIRSVTLKLQTLLSKIDNDHDSIDVVGEIKGIIQELLVTA